MQVEEMIAAIESDTEAEAAFILPRLNAALSWAANRLMAVNRELLKVTDNQITVGADTKSFDLAANVSTGALQSIEWMGIKYSGDQTFYPVTYIGGNEDMFLWWDQQVVQAVYPQFADLNNYDRVRFAPGLPSGTIIRVDYLYTPRQFSLNSQVTSDIPALFDQCLISEATSRCFKALDDDRFAIYHGQAVDEFNGAWNVLTARQYQQPRTTRPSNRATPAWRR